MISCGNLQSIHQSWPAFLKSFSHRSESLTQKCPFGCKREWKYLFGLQRLEFTRTSILDWDILSHPDWPSPSDLLRQWWDLYFQACSHWLDVFSRLVYNIVLGESSKFIRFRKFQKCYTFEESEHQHTWTNRVNRKKSKQNQVRLRNIIPNSSIWPHYLFCSKS